MIYIFNNIKVFSDTILDVNEDIAYCDDNCAWILDGATPLYNKTMVDPMSDAKWFVKMFNDFLLHNLKDESKSISQIVYNGIREIKKLHACICGKTVEKKFYPSASCSIMRMINNKISFFIMGDCETIFKFKNDEIKHFSDPKLKELDKISLSAGIKARKKYNKDFLDCQEDMLPILRKNRSKLNTKNGYYSLSCDSSAVFHAITGEIFIDKLKSVYLMSDGFYQYYETFRLANNISEFTELIKNEKIDKIYRNLINAQRADDKLNNYPRFKLSDDASLIYFEVI